MPRPYKMSADTSEQEKVIGGKLTVAQGLWLGLGVAIIAVVMLILKNFMAPLAALVLALPPGLAVGLAFAFYKKEELTLYQYLTLKYQFKHKNKILLNTMTYGKKFKRKES